MRFSIITPSLNQSPWIGDNLRSVQEAASQANIKVEHLVVDGGSSDGTLAILAEQNSAKWLSEPDAGQSDAINKGMVRASGDILCYLCADDFFEPQALALVADAFRSTTADVVYGDSFFLESDSGWKRRKRPGPFSYGRLRWNNFLIQPAVFWRRSVYERFGPFDITLRYCMDHDFWLRIGADTKWVYVEQPLATARLHANAKTSRALAEAWREACRMQRRHGIYIKPRFDALWMAALGCHYYRMKRMVFARLGHKRAQLSLS